MISNTQIQNNQGQSFADRDIHNIPDKAWGCSGTMLWRRYANALSDTDFYLNRCLFREIVDSSRKCILVTFHDACMKSSMPS